ncbi:hypothetical protein WJX72_008686 [[Myrmecia] bisecta]|uniref:LYR motif-containing protein 2 n=1 Tax=[Myrmecia] bisecta TaxID=41462 RepID=A0AAW1P9C6_9CHLO
MGDVKAFVFRGEVLRLYRAFLRTSKQAPDQSRGELKQQIREQFELHRDVTDTYAKKYHLSGGRAQLKRLGEMLAMRL